MDIYVSQFVLNYIYAKKLIASLTLKLENKKP